VLLRSELTQLINIAEMGGRELVDAALRELSRSCDRLYSRDGRPSILPERLLRALLLQAFYTVRSERQLMEQLSYNLVNEVCGRRPGRTAAAPLAPAAVTNDGRCCAIRRKAGCRARLPLPRTSRPR
jgi:hypothetical protein